MNNDVFTKLTPGEQEAAAENPSLSRRVCLTLQQVSAQVIDQDGKLHQERLFVLDGTLEDILRAAYGQAGLELMALGQVPGNVQKIDVDIDASVWDVERFSVSPARNIRVVVSVQPDYPLSDTLPQGPPGLSGVGEGGDAT